jgi:hypothetical protein
VDRMVPWATGLEWEGRTVECRFDSVSWATDMAESDYVYDGGRIVGEKGIMLWAPPGFRPRVIRSDAPLSEEAGTVEVRKGDRPRALRLWARDLGGRRAEKSVVLIASNASDKIRRVTAVAGGSPRLSFASLPGGRLRVTDRGAPAGSERVRMTLGGGAQGFNAMAGASGHTTVIPIAEGGRGAPRTETLGVEGSNAGKRWVFATPLLAARVGPEDSSELVSGAFRVGFGKGAMFEDCIVFVADTDPMAERTSSGELTARSGSHLVGPEKLPLRRAATISLQWEGGPTRGIGLYRQSDDGWEWVGVSYDSATGRFSAESRRLGRFALLHDGQAPRTALRAVPKQAQTKPYSRWAVEATVVERGSGLDSRAAYFEVDGRRVPTEWDAEERILRWRPARRPAAGSHRLRIVATDKAGNRAETTVRFRS